MTATAATNTSNSINDDLILEIEHYDELCPEGAHPARLVDVVDVGEEESYGKTQRKLWLVWQVFPVDPDNGEVMRQSSGIPFKIDKKYTRSLFPGNNSVQPSALYADIDTWTGGKLSGGKLSKFSLNDLYNVPCLITVSHVTAGNNVYANITAIEPFTGENPPQPEQDSYTRSDYSKRKPKAKQPDAPAVADTSPFVDQSQLPTTHKNYVPF